MEQHWSTRDVGTLPAREISRFIHFADNDNLSAATDLAWKIRSVLDTLETTFKEGTFMKDKPHRWGSKYVMVCRAETEYCKRYLDIGRFGDTECSQSMETTNGPTAVIRNIASGYLMKDVGLLLATAITRLSHTLNYYAPWDSITSER
ncbi:hypothetical protein PHMEG_00011161 [Phytophthora megakarya]|uniref:Uncharacterized protein n=1 Tax=Phytophthora megakarya TaxID=4795 RepID=A0A225WEE5_9STRA|nr:hypothetical protein PHMEG_00011161 [Phytophthora megakarya]